MSQWLEVSVITDGEAAEAVAEALRPLAYNDGVVLEQLGDADNLDPTALEPEVTVKIFLPGEEDTPATRRRIEEILYFLGRLYPIPEPSFRRLEEQDWANAWKAHYQPFRIGRRIWIQPSWVSAEETGAAEGEEMVTLTLDPGMAFGTGLHPTTQTCLQALEQLVRPGDRVLDVGTGSGILAIAAARLGAERVLAVDTDPEAVKAAAENAALNDVAGAVEVRAGGLESVLSGQWQVVVVNILAPIIVAMLRGGALMARVAPEGRLILSGIIDQQLEDVEAALADAGASSLEHLVVRDWVTVIAGWAGPDRQSDRPEPEVRSDD